MSCREPASDDLAPKCWRWLARLQFLVHARTIRTTCTVVCTRSACRVWHHRDLAGQRSDSRWGSCSLNPTLGFLVGLAQAINLSCTRRVGNVCIQRPSWEAYASQWCVYPPVYIQWAEKKTTVAISLVPSPPSNLGTRLKSKRGNPGNLSILACVLCHESRSCQIIPSTLGYFYNILPRMFRKLVRFGQSYADCY